MTRSMPRVSFVVPCYRLGHLLSECVGSILDQTFTDLEVLIMDDHSPDDTPSIARSFHDPRVRHVRNSVNLGHLANYNKGLGLSRGTFAWLISADDRLSRPYVLERYITLLEDNPDVGFVFCPAVRFRDADELGVYGSHGPRDAVWEGRDFLKSHLLNGNSVPAPAGLARRTSYERVGLFPLDLPFAGDWYMWCVFALHFKVGYLAEPMVGYRDHPLNMTKSFKQRRELLMADEFEVLWRLLEMIAKTGDRLLSRFSVSALAGHYAYRVVARARDADAIGLTPAEFEDSLAPRTAARGLAAVIRSVVYTALGDHHYETRRLDEARRWYGRALRYRAGDLRTLVKFALVHMGPIGRAARFLLQEPRPGRMEPPHQSALSGSR